MGPSFQNYLPRWKVLLELHTENTEQFERIYTQIKMQHTCPRVTEGTGAAQPLLCWTVLITHYTNPMQVHPTVSPVSIPPLGTSSLAKSRMISTLTPLHRLKDKFQGVLWEYAYHCAHTAFKTSEDSSTTMPKSNS